MVSGFRCVEYYVCIKLMRSVLLLKQQDLIRSTATNATCRTVAGVQQFFQQHLPPQGQPGQVETPHKVAACSSATWVLIAKYCLVFKAV